MKEMNSTDILKLSPYDDSFPARLLEEAFDYRIKEAQITTERIYKDIVKSANYTPCIPDKGEEKLRLVVDTTDELLQDYMDGAVKLAKEKGHLVAQIKENGRYGSKLPIKEEFYIDGENYLDIQNSLQIQALHDALVVVSEQIQAIDENVKDVLCGQQNDRLAQYYSGVSLYIEASNVDDENLKKQLISQSIKALSDATFQLTLALQSDIAYLERKEYDKDKKHKFTLINEKISNINRSFMAIHQSSIMKAGIYCQQGELKAMATVLQEYERFIRGSIVNNAELLSQCDYNDNGTTNGIWKKRANLQLEVGDIVNQLQSSNSVLYIDSKGDKKHESI